MAIPVAGFFLGSDSGGTLQQRIRALIVEGVRGGRLRPGDRLPSSRALAAHLGVSRLTVTLAYAELVAGDFLTTRDRSGYYVAPGAPADIGLPASSLPAATRVDWGRAIGRRFSGARLLERPEDWRTYPFPFIYGQADATLFDHQNWRQCALQALGRRDFEQLTADTYSRDDPMLIDYILRVILPRRGISARPEEVLLTMGAQNALWMTCALLLGPGRRGVLENPSYAGFQALLAQSGCERRFVDVDGEGLVPDAIPPGADAVFVTPSHQSPTNATLPADRRRRLLDLASDRDFLIVEDDYEFEMSFLRPPLPALKSLDAEGRVIYVGSFSKSLFPGLRLGYLVAPEPFIREARALRAQVLRHPPGHQQRTTAYFLALGHYDTLLGRMSQALRRRRQVMAEAIAAHGLKVAGAPAFGGSSFWMEAPDGADTDSLAARLRARGVLIEPGRVFFDPDRPRTNFYRLAYSSIPQGRITEGIALVADELARRP
jgi:GntR family transcriptional regulator/MocR family aminotransferase